MFGKIFLVLPVKGSLRKIWKFSSNAQDFAETVQFYKISTPGN